MRRLAVALLLALAACGQRQDLRPAEGQNLPPAPVGAPAPPSAGELLTPPAVARPSRTEEVITRSEEREGDPFDLPPT